MILFKPGEDGVHDLCRGDRSGSVPVTDRLILAGAAVAHLGLEVFPEGHAFEVEIDDTEKDSAAFRLAVGVHF